MSRKPVKRRRLPNGFGQITEIKGKNLRKPFRAMVTIGKNENGRPICKLLEPEAYFETYNDAYAALVEHHKNPYELESNITMRELYDKWFETYKGNSRSMTSAWKYCSSVYDMKACDIRARHIKGCMENGTMEYRGKIRKPSDNVKTRIKSIFNALMDYAMEYDLINKNYARSFSIPEDIKKSADKVKKPHLVFTDAEMDILWEHKDDEYVDLMLIQCYSGWRPQELGLIRMEDVDFENWTFTGGMKTDSGKDRTVPIHEKIRDLVKKEYDKAESLGSEYIFTCPETENCASGIKLTYDKYKNRFYTAVEELGLSPKHRPHDPRKHFVTLCKKYDVNEYAIKYMVGHVVSDVTEKIYTQRDDDWLAREIEKIR